MNAARVIAANLQTHEISTHDVARVRQLTAQISLAAAVAADSRDDAGDADDVEVLLLSAPTSGDDHDDDDSLLPPLKTELGVVLKSRAPP